MKEYLVTTIDKVRTTYLVPAKSEEEARKNVEEPERSYTVIQEEFYDLDSIEEIKENN